MKNKLLSLVALATLLPGAAQVFADPIPKDRVQVMNAIASNDTIRPHQSGFPDTVRANLVKTVNKALDHNTQVKLFGSKKSWKPLSKVKSLTEAGIQILKMEVSTQQFTKGKLTVTGVKTGTFYLNGEEVSGDDGEYSLSLVSGEHRLLLVTEQVDNWKKVAIDWTGDNVEHSVTFHEKTPKHRLNAKQMYDSQTISQVSISPDGKQMIWTKKYYSEATGDKSTVQTELLDTKSQSVLYRWQGMTPGSLNWSPDNRSISYSAKNKVHLLKRQGFELTTIASGLEGAGDFNWYDNETLIFSWNREDESGHEFTKRYRALEDRWPGWRNNSQVYLMDVNSGFIKQLTQNKLSHYVLDTDAKNNRILVGRNPVDYKKPAHGITELVEFDLETEQEKIIGKYRTFNGALYAKDGIYILAGPSFGNRAGATQGREQAINDYDTQLYLMNKKGDIKALSKQFDPSISDFDLLINGDILLSVSDEDRIGLYIYQTRGKAFKKIDSKIDVIDDYSVSKQKKSTIVYYGTSSTSPQSVYLKGYNKTPKLLLNSAKTHYANTRFPQIKEWDFKNSKGENIDGRYYLPSNFDKNKKYPAIVYYYGGTSAVNRSFTGRWPFSLWAAQGYVVYVIQPSGATGYGQEFSAKHVNAWGKDTADDIITASKAFLKEHPFVDEKRVGNMGASYGGFMTMYLATKTDMFSASISHAGISNLAEYWGFGWWGYGYSGVASQGSFPWNNRELYIEQSPLFSADKITTPMLLLHGDSDTNVPVTESHQMYSALRIQDKDVEFIEFIGDDHHINGRTHRLRWWNTIMAYLDNKLKDQPLWWDTLYPEK
jgi:dipeptidyl aminopeptidase/acylaminoacyl peptidase